VDGVETSKTGEGGRRTERVIISLCNDNCVDLEKTKEHRDHACDEWYPCHLAVMFKLYENKSVSGSK
jgi:hypothetical protein